MTEPWEVREYEARFNGDPPAMNEVESKIDVYEVDGCGINYARECWRVLKVQSHGTHDNLVVLEFSDHSATVSADDLRRAIAKAAI